MNVIIAHQAKEKGGARVRSHPRASFDRSARLRAAFGHRRTPIAGRNENERGTSLGSDVELAERRHAESERHAT